MSTESLDSFLTDYVMSLVERTRIENGVVKIGFDWIIYNLALANSWTPVRLPFFRRSNVLAAKTKTEAEFGIDMMFSLPTGKGLVIFVLKDEELNNKNWTSQSFESDLRKAATPDLTPKELELIREVKVILAYNKDEDRNGIELFDRLTNSLGTKIGDKVSLSFERWNLSRITEMAKDYLISPDLLPQHLSSQFSYICSQMADFDYGTIEWESQLIPNWKYFLRKLLKEPIDERKLRLVPVTLLILYHYKKQSPNSYPGWIDLIEWAILSLWECYRNLKTRKLKKIVIDIWMHFYINELERYFLKVSHVLTTEHGLHASGKGVGLVPINDAYMAYWHIGRLGILTLAPQEFTDEENKEGKEIIINIINRSADWIIRCLRVNPATTRPLIDLNHIELFLVWLILWQSGRDEEIFKWLSQLESCLLVRRIGKTNIPFIEARNRIDLVAECAATSEKPPEYTDNSSYLLLMILELCFSLEDKYRDELLDRYYRRIVKGMSDDGKSLADKEIDLIGWSSPDNWGQRILREHVTDGIAITINNFETISGGNKSLSERIKGFVDRSSEKFPSKIPANIPRAVLILACIKHRSPLPSEFWRGTIFTRDKKIKKF
ncbi:MAG: hypothetical protein ACE5KZ_05560 [Candidatus Scalinduaceae bacterium]